MTTNNSISAFLGLIVRSFSVRKDRREPPIHKKRTPPRSMTPAEVEYYNKHKHLNGLYN